MESCDFSVGFFRFRCESATKFRLGRTVPVRNLADNVWCPRTWVPSFRSTSVADITSSRPSLSSDLHTTGGRAFGQERRSLGGRERRDALKPETRNSSSERPRKHENKNKTPRIFYNNK
ncbi:hypothetical protein Zmor_023354 [Zophobas morio]|uniref:Uncharacterized protein n=1 Tax=Zophobas morio TaxID=2755281 RepID=A0AA38HWX1_9CUCU|nr:hypothetical protein Zmor_023354 [Zophobas morio]